MQLNERHLPVLLKGETERAVLQNVGLLNLEFSNHIPENMLNLGLNADAKSFCRPLCFLKDSLEE